MSFQSRPCENSLADYCKVKWATLFRANTVIILMQVNSLTLNNLHYILSDLKKAATPAQVVEKILVWH